MRAPAWLPRVLLESLLTVLRLSRLYDDQARYADRARAVAEMMYGEGYRDGPQQIARRTSNLLNLGLFRFRETELLRRYGQVLGSGPVARAP